MVFQDAVVRRRVVGTLHTFLQTGDSDSPAVSPCSTKKSIQIWRISEPVRVFIRSPEGAVGNHTKFDIHDSNPRMGGSAALA